MIKLWEKVRDCWANEHETRITPKLSTATRGGGRVAKIDRGPVVPIIKMTTFLRHPPNLQSEHSEPERCIS